GVAWLSLTYAGTFLNVPNATNTPYYASTHVPVVLGVLLAGVMGGVLSTYNRLQNTPIGSGEPVEELVKLTQGRWSIVISPFLGGAFAVILFVLMAGKLLQGGLLPAFADPASNPNYPVTAILWLFTWPASVGDAAKLLVWAFIAGFAERLVP